MSNYAFLTVGSEAEFARLRSEHQGPIVASCAYGVPLLWLAMFAADEVKATCNEGEGEEAYIGCQTSVSTAITRVRTQHRRLSSLFDKAPDLRQHSEMLAEVLAGRSEPLVEADLTEVALMDEGDRFATELRLFLDWIGSGQWPREYRPKHRNLLARLFAKSSGPGEFVRVHCNLERKTIIPESERIRNYKTLSADEERVVSYVLGSSWEDPVPWVR